MRFYTSSHYTSKYEIIKIKTYVKLHKITKQAQNPGWSLENDCKFWWTDWQKLMVWLTDGLTDWRTDKLLIWQTDGRTDGLTDWQTVKLTNWRTDGRSPIFNRKRIFENISPTKMAMFKKVFYVNSSCVFSKTIQLWGQNKSVGHWAWHRLISKPKNLNFRRYLEIKRCTSK